MGPNKSKEDYIRKHPIKGDADEFYFACKEGNIEYVKRTLPSLTLEQLNKMQRNGSTYLHVASYNGRVEIVRLLLEHGCIRSKLNLHGLTAYEEACTDDVKSLFDRPRNEHGENRFVDVNINETFHLTSMVAVNEHSKSTIETTNDDESRTENPEDDDDDDFLGNDWIEAFNNFDKYSAMIFNTAMRSTLFYRLIGIKKDTLHLLMKHILDHAFKQSDQDFRLVDAPLNEYVTTKNIASVIYLYTLETSFYSSTLHDAGKCGVFTMLLYQNLSQLTERFYKGITYRGVKMTNKDLDAYRSIARHKGYALMNTKFQSTSMERSEAENFLWPPDTSEENDDHKYDVLMIYNFQETCQSAINLSLVNGKYLSGFPQEAEVLVLPYSLFEVCDMNFDAQEQKYLITLKNIVPPGIYTSFKCALKEFMNMPPNELRQTMRRLEANMNVIMDLNKKISE